MVLIKNSNTYRCNDDVDIKDKIENSFVQYKYLEPFDYFYSHIKEYIYKKYYVYECNFSNRKYSIVNVAKFNRYDPHPSIYSTDNLPVYLRTKPELKEMFKPSYYKSFSYLHYDAMNYNPTLFNSSQCNEYIITPTVSPYTNNIVMLGYVMGSDYSKTAYDFFFDPKLIYDMYKIWKDLGDDYLIYNSLEVGSLPEIYHFHVQKAKLYEPIFNLVTTIDGIELYLVEDSPQTNLYAIKIIPDILYKIPYLLWQCREYNDGNNIYKYCAQIYFYKFASTDYVLFSFRKVNVNNIRISGDGTSMVSAYYSELFGNALNDYSIIYLPVGIISYTNKHNKPFKINKNIIESMKRPYVQNPLIVDKFMKYMSEKYKVTYDNAQSDDHYQYFDIDVQIKSTMLNPDEKNRIINIKYYVLPKLYSINQKKIFRHDVTTSRIQLTGNDYYAIECNNDTLHHDIIKCYKIEDVFPKYYCTINNVNNYVSLFSPVKTTLDKFIQIDMNILRHNSELINAFIIFFLFKLKKISQRGVYFKDLKLNQILVVDENKGMIDCNFDTFTVSVTTENNNFGVKHYGNNIMFDFIELYHSSNDVLLQEMLLLNYKQFILQLYDLCIGLNIYNYLLTDTYQIVSETDNISKCVDLFKFGINLYNYRTSYYRLLDFINVEFVCREQHELYHNCTEKITDKDTPECNHLADNFELYTECVREKKIMEKICHIEYNNFQQCTNINNVYYDIVNKINKSKYDLTEDFKVVNIDRKNIFVSAVNNTIDYPYEFYTEMQFEANPIIYAVTQTELLSKKYQRAILSYMNKGSFSRLIFMSSKKSIPLLKIESNQKRNIDVDIANYKDVIYSWNSINEYEDFLANKIINMYDLDIDAGTLIDKITKYSDMVNFTNGSDVFCQDLFNFAFKIRYPHLAGYFDYNPLDMTLEFIFTNVSEYFDIISVAKPSADRIYLFYEESMFRKFIDSERNKYEEKYNIKDIDYVKNIAGSLDNIFFINSILLDSNYNFFNRPLMKNNLFVEIKPTDPKLKSILL